jgi:hypothetical protein
MEYASREVLLECLKHLQNSSGNASLMSAELMSTLAEHALGNYRVLTTMAAELLATAAQSKRPRLDEQLYLEVFGAPTPAALPRSLRGTHPCCTQTGLINPNRRSPYE